MGIRWSDSDTNTLNLILEYINIWVELTNDVSQEGKIERWHFLTCSSARDWQSIDLKEKVTETHTIPN